jgi:aspartate/methionine/tyrosine aminotransferase
MSDPHFMKQSKGDSAGIEPDAASVLDTLPAKIQLLQEEIAKVVVGQEENVDAALYALFSRGHCLLVGVPGLAKTLLVQALAKLKSYLDYGTFQPIQIAATVAMNEAPDFPKEVNEIYRGRRDALIDGLARIGWHIERPKGTMFVWAPIPEPYAEMTSIEFATMVVQEAKVAVSPGVGFGPGGEGFVRFALVENEHRIRQATRSIKQFLKG